MKASAKKSNVAEQTVQPWDDRPGASQTLWNGANVLERTQVPEPATPLGQDKAADYAYGIAVGRECARDHVRALSEIEMDSSFHVDIVTDLVQDTERDETVKRGCLVGFLEEIGGYVYAGVEAANKPKESREYVALFGSRGLALEIKDHPDDVREHLAVLTKAHHALGRLARAAFNSDPALHVDNFAAAQDGLEFINAMTALFAECAVDRPQSA